MFNRIGYPAPCAYHDPNYDVYTCER